MNYAELNGHSIREGFNKFHRENPHIFEEFERQAFKAIHLGREKISAKLIVNWIRWNEILRSNDKNFKINDAYQSYYARAFVAKYPKHTGKFEFRKLRNEKNGPFMTVDEKGQMTFT